MYFPGFYHIHVNIGFFLAFCSSPWYNRSKFATIYLSVLFRVSDLRLEVTMDIYQQLLEGNAKLSLVGLGYVGMPIAVAV